MANQNLAEDFRILRKQVPEESFPDNLLKKLFQENNFDPVKTILATFDYSPESETSENKTETQKKLDELRQISNAKDTAMEVIKNRHV